MLALLAAQLIIMGGDSTNARAAYEGYKRALQLFPIEERPLYFWRREMPGMVGQVDSVVNIFPIKGGNRKSYYNAGLHEGFHLLNIMEVYVQALTAKYALEDTVWPVSRASALHYLRHGPLPKALALPLGIAWNSDSVEALVRAGGGRRRSPFEELPYTIGEGLLEVANGAQQRAIFPCSNAPITLGEKEKVRLIQYLLHLREEEVGDSIDKNLWNSLHAAVGDCDATKGGSHH